MYYTHHFATHEALARTQAWLKQLGFAPEDIESHTDGIPRLSIAVEPSRLPVVEMLIHAIERSDPHGWPGYWDVAHQVHVYPVPAMPDREVEPMAVRSTAIGWHPADRGLPVSAATGPEAYGESLSQHWS